MYEVVYGFLSVSFRPVCQNMKFSNHRSIYSCLLLSDILRIIVKYKIIGAHNIRISSSLVSQIFFFSYQLSQICIYCQVYFLNTSAFTRKVFFFPCLGLMNVQSNMKIVETYSRVLVWNWHESVKVIHAETETGESG